MSFCISVFLCISVTSLIILFSILSNHIKINASWKVIINDAIVAVQIDRYPHWSDINAMGYPKDNTGRQVTSNHYERLAWATMGVRLISQYPLGYGSINQSFVGLLDQAEIKQELESQAHSGWIDFGLAFGVPGLLILFLTFALTVYFGLMKRDQFGLMGAWLVIGLMPLGLIAEISYKHNFEILLFFIAFAATSSISIKNVNS
jgi:hypothetical protein